MGRADTGGKMELRASEDASETRWSRRDACRDDPHSHRSFDSQSDSVGPMEEAETSQLSCLHFGRSES